MFDLISSFEREPDDDHFLPSQYDEMLKIMPVYKNSDRIDSVKQFYLQIKFMIDFTDDYDFEGEIRTFKYIYSSLSIHQLRGYFAFRTALRQGIARNTNVEFYHIYFNELLNQACYTSPHYCFEKMLDALVVMDKSNKYFSISIKKTFFFIISDFIVLQGLDKSCFDRLDYHIPVLSLRLQRIKDSITKDDYNNFSDYLQNFTTANFSKSKFYVDYKEDFDKIFLDIFKKLTAPYADSFFEFVFSAQVKTSWTPLKNCIIYKKPNENMFYEINDLEKYERYNGMMTRYFYFEYRIKESAIEFIFRKTDYLMRKIYGYRTTVEKKNDYSFPEIEYIITEYCAKYKKTGICKKLKPALKDTIPEKPIPQIPVHVDIDKSKLHSIRDSSEKIKNALIIEEEIDIAPVKIKKQPEFVHITPAFNDNPYTAFVSSLKQHERDIILAVMLNSFTDVNAIAVKANILLEVMFEEINNKALITIGDVVADTGDNYKIYDDYKSDIENALKSTSL